MRISATFSVQLRTRSPTTGQTPEDYSKEAAFWSMCGPKFRSMNYTYTSEVDDYNKQVHGIEKKDYSDLVEKLVTPK
jgi:hypothetical protein